MYILYFVAYTFGIMLKRSFNETHWLNLRETDERLKGYHHCVIVLRFSS